MNSNGQPYGLVRFEFTEGEKPRDMSPSPAWRRQPPPRFFQPIVINKDTGEIIEIKETIGFGNEFDYTKCLVGTKMQPPADLNPFYIDYEKYVRDGKPDYIRMCNDISTQINDFRFKGVFRIDIAADGKRYLFYDGGEFDGKLVILDREGRALRYPAIKANIALSLMNPGLFRKDDGSRFQDLMLQMLPRQQLIYNLGNPDDAAATATPAAATAEPKMGGKRLKKNSKSKKKLKKRSR